MTRASSNHLPRGFWTYLAGMAGMSLGDALLSLAMPFLALRLSTVPDERAVALVFLAGSLPRFAAPLLGSVADRLTPRAAIGVASGLRAAAVLSVAGLALAGMLPYWGLLALAAANALLNTLIFAAGSALVPRLVPDELLARANALNSGVMMGLPLVGLGLGGVLLGLLTPASVYLCAVPLLALAPLAAFFLPKLAAAEAGKASVLGLWHDLRTIFGQTFLTASFGFSFGLNIGLNVMNARAPLALRGAGGDIHAYVVFEVLVAGSILAGITWASRGRSVPQLHRFAVLGAALVTLGLLPMLSAAAEAWWAGAVCFGVGLGLVSVATTTRSQQLVPTAERGRTMGALIGLNALGLTLGAALAASALSTPTLMLGLALGLGAAAWTLARAVQAG
ncbi:MFS transporter [Deinococcus sp. SL84]|uniref:MFS transporter n=1 Tax=Deinococcus sp. SL84 TaxID=2994663 RepID=UPI002277025C|nr:MFS transporter [Deinococcus sp. SL84]MCY1701854.1 MFS transporter [Deinococcus sp. SL84]